MKLSIEINDKVKVLLLELLQDQEIKNEIIKVIDNEIRKYDSMTPYLSESDVEDVVYKRTKNFLTEDEVQDAIMETLTCATFTTEFEG